MAGEIRYVDPKMGTGRIYIDENGDGIDDTDGITRIPGNAIEQQSDGQEWLDTGKLFNGEMNTVFTNEDATPPGSLTPDGVPTPLDADAEFDADASLAQSEEEVAAANGGSGSGYSPGQYNPTAVVRYEDKPKGVKDYGDDYYYGSGDAYRGGIVEAPRGEMDSTNWLQAPGTNMQDLVWSASKAYYGYDAAPAQAGKLYSDAVAMSANKGITVQAALREIAASGNGSGGSKNGKGGSGSGGPFTNVTKTVQVTDAGEAERLLNASLATYLGRRATEGEMKEFVKQLNRSERLNPTVTTTKGVRSSGGTTQTQEQEGGFDSTNFAEKWARGREGAAEYQAATTYMDAFTKVIDELEY